MPGIGGVLDSTEDYGPLCLVRLCTNCQLAIVAVLTMHATEWLANNINFALCHMQLPQTTSSSLGIQ